MGIVTDETINKQLSQVKGQADVLQTIPVNTSSFSQQVTDVKDIINSVQEIIKMVFNKQQTPQNPQQPIKAEYQQMANPDKKVLSDEMIKKYLDDKLKLMPLLPAKLKQSTVMDLVKEWKENPESQKMVIKAIRGALDEIK